MSKYKYHAKCSQCGVGWRAMNRSELLERMRRHLWSKHGDWMRGRIKRGLKRARKVSGDNPKWLDAILPGVFPPAAIPGLLNQYRGMTPEQRSLVKTVVTALTIPVGAEASAIAGVVLKALDKAA